MSAILNWIAWLDADRPAERLPLLRVLHRLVDAALRQPDAERRDRDAPLVEDRQELRVAAAPLAEQVLGRHAAVGERQLAGVGGVPADLGVLLRDREPRRARRHDDGRDLLLAAVGRPGDRGDRDQPGDVGARVGDERLGAVDDPLAAVVGDRAVVVVPPASEPAPGSVRPNAPIIAPERSRGSHSRFCSSVPNRKIGIAPSETPGLQRDRHRRVDPGQLLQGDAQREVVAAHAAVLLGERQAEQPHLAHLADDVVGELVALVEVADGRRHDLLGELLDGLAQRLELVAEGAGGHGVSLPVCHRGCASAPACHVVCRSSCHVRRPGAASPLGFSTWHTLR